MILFFFWGRKMKSLLLAAVFASLAGCATATTGVVPRGDGLHTITRQGNGFWVATDSLKSAALVEADAYCKRDGKTMKVIYSKEIPAGGGGRWPEAEILFKCE